MSVTRTIRRHSSSKTLIRLNGFTVVNRVNTPNAKTNTTIDVHVQPLSAKELRNVPEGQNTMQWVNMWSLTEIKEQDLIDVYTVQKVKYWPEGPFWHAQAVRVSN